MNGQTLSPAWQVWIGMWQTTSQVAGEPVLVKPANDSMQDEQLPSQVSGTSTTLLPQTAPKLSAKMMSVSARAMPPLIAATQPKTRKIFPAQRQRTEFSSPGKRVYAQIPPFAGAVAR
jgi:hypothetical protein